MRTSGKRLNHSSFMFKKKKIQLNGHISDQDLLPGEIPDWEEILVKVQKVLNG